ncbi:hypothetical protein 1 [Beihai sobemo-like virus 18]|uniref:hypothetical protein 1 n=1 Tax=Beihai sobemo-like virus 18 TaxID=1922689 RepID=UPI00090BFB48|nr:hypothetical protein 1 [Beihai sobemo-like virus 18]APG75714.1 hypothetical protein 1 [Beihai sobemo-like virus 18]
MNTSALFAEFLEYRKMRRTMFQSSPLFEWFELFIVKAESLSRMFDIGKMIPMALTVSSLSLSLCMMLHGLALLLNVRSRITSFLSSIFRTLRYVLTRLLPGVRTYLTVIALVVLCLGTLHIALECFDAFFVEVPDEMEPPVDISDVSVATVSVLLICVGSYALLIWTNLDRLVLDYSYVSSEAAKQIDPNLMPGSVAMNDPKWLVTVGARIGNMYTIVGQAFQINQSYVEDEIWFITARHVVNHIKSYDNSIVTILTSTGKPLTPIKQVQLSDSLPDCMLLIVARPKGWNEVGLKVVDPPFPSLSTDFVCPVSIYARDVPEQFQVRASRGKAGYLVKNAGMILHHTADTVPGWSGSPILVTGDEGKLEVMGIHLCCSGQTNNASRNMGYALNAVLEAYVKSTYGGVGNTVSQPVKHELVTEARGRPRGRPRTRRVKRENKSKRVFDELYNRLESRTGLQISRIDEEGANYDLFEECSRSLDATFVNHHEVCQYGCQSPEECPLCKNQVEILCGRCDWDDRYAHDEDCAMCNTLTAVCMCITTFGGQVAFANHPTRVDENGMPEVLLLWFGSDYYPATTVPFSLNIGIDPQPFILHKTIGGEAKGKNKGKGFRNLNKYAGSTSPSVSDPRSFLSWFDDPEADRTAFSFFPTVLPNKDVMWIVRDNNSGRTSTWESDYLSDQIIGRLKTWVNAEAKSPVLTKAILDEDDQFIALHDSILEDEFYTVLKVRSVPISDSLEDDRIAVEKALEDYRYAMEQLGSTYDSLAMRARLLIDDVSDDAAMISCQLAKDIQYVCDTISNLAQYGAQLTQKSNDICECSQVQISKRRLMAKKRAKLRKEVDFQPSQAINDIVSTCRGTVNQALRMAESIPLRTYRTESYTAQYPGDPPPNGPSSDQPDKKRKLTEEKLRAGFAKALNATYDYGILTKLKDFHNEPKTFLDFDKVRQTTSEKEEDSDFSKSASSRLGSPTTPTESVTPRQFHPTLRSFSRTTLGGSTHPHQMMEVENMAERYGTLSNYIPQLPPRLQKEFQTLLNGKHSEESRYLRPEGLMRSCPTKLEADSLRGLLVSLKDNAYLSQELMSELMRRSEN